MNLPITAFVASLLKVAEYCEYKDTLKAPTSSRRMCLHFHCIFWFPHQTAYAHVALLGPCFKMGQTRASEYQQRLTLTHGCHSPPQLALRAVYMLGFLRCSSNFFSIHEVSCFFGFFGDQALAICPTLLQR